MQMRQSYGYMQMKTWTVFKNGHKNPYSNFTQTNAWLWHYNQNVQGWKVISVITLLEKIKGGVGGVNFNDVLDFELHITKKVNKAGMIRRFLTPVLTYILTSMKFEK